MSDFDREAERERLREKYERDEQKREVTERMSELLLQGATMTNAHCQDCGDPIFRYDGQEFCPTCEKAVQRDAGEDADGDEAAESDGDSADEDEATPAANGDQEEIEVASPDETRVRFGAQDETAPAEGDAEADDAAAPTAKGGDDRQGPPQAEQSPAEQSPAKQSPASQPAGQVPSVEPGEVGESGDLAAAHAALSRTVTRLAQQAEASENLGQKRDLLAATREAAEALSALRDASR